MAEPVTAQLPPSTTLTRTSSAEPREGAPPRVRRITVSRAVTVGTVAWAALLAGAGVLAHEAFATTHYDLGNYVQAIHNTAHGHLFEATTQAGDQVTRLGIHVEPILLLLAGLWRIWPSPLLLVVLQPVVLAAGALPTYWLARKHLGSERQAAVFAAAYLLYPATQWNAVGDFHPVSLAPTFILFAIWYLDEDRIASAVPFLVLAAATKEHMPLLVAWLGICYWVWRKRRLPAAAIIAGGLSWFAIEVLVILPHFAPGVDLFAERYGGLGDSPSELLATVLQHPARAAGELGVEDLAYAVFLGLPLCGLWAVSPLLALGALPEFALSVLSSKPEQTSISGQYTASLIPFLVGASVLGAAALSPPMRRRAVRYLIGVAALAGVISPLWSLPFSLAELGTQKHAAQAAALHLVPRAAPVTATNELGAQLAERRVLYGFPQRRGAEWVLVDLDDPIVADVKDERLFARSVRDLRRDRRFRLVYDRERVLVFRRVSAAAST